MTSIDLLSQDEAVQEVDFFDFARRDKKGGRYDVIVLALVLNFVGSAEQRGVMLAECARLLKPGGLLFVVLPDAAVSNSRVSRVASAHLRSHVCSTSSLACCVVCCAEWGCPLPTARQPTK